MKQEKKILQELFSSSLEDKNKNKSFVQIMLSNIDIQDCITIEIKRSLKKRRAKSK